MEAKTNAFGVNLPCYFKEAKHFEELALVFLFDAYTCVVNADLNHSVLSFVAYQVCLYVNETSSRCELERVTLEV